MGWDTHASPLRALEKALRELGAGKDNLRRQWAVKVAGGLDAVVRSSVFGG